MPLRIKYFFFFISFFCTTFSQNANDRKVKADPKGLTVEDFTKMVNNTSKPVFIHFEAEWCALCKKLKPILKEIEAERGDRIEMFNINTDDNPLVSKHLEIDGLPVMILYKQGKIVWSMQGFLTKKEILGNLDAYMETK